MLSFRYYIIKSLLLYKNEVIQMYDIRYDILMLNCLYQEGLIDSEEMFYMRDYLESIVDAQ